MHPEQCYATTVGEIGQSAGETIGQIFQPRRENSQVCGPALVPIADFVTSACEIRLHNRK